MKDWFKSILGYCLAYALRVVVGFVVICIILFALNHFGML